MQHQLKHCVICKKIFDRPLRSKKGVFKVSWSIYQKIKFCSPKCRIIHYSKIMKGRNNPNWKGGLPKCIDCGKQLFGSHNKRCKQCWYQFYRGEKHPNWKGGNKKFCIDCGKPVLRTSKWCLKCWGKHFRSKNSPRYKEKLTNYRYSHKIIRDTFGHPSQCEHCGIKSQNHHFIHWANKSGEYLRDRNDWIALCVPCHKKYDKNVS